MLQCSAYRHTGANTLQACGVHVRALSHAVAIPPGDPALGAPVLLEQPVSDPATSNVLNGAAVTEYLACEGEWAGLQVEAPVADVALGRAVAELAVQSQAAAASEQLPQLSDLPLRLAVVSGKHPALAGKPCT